ncbi:MAG TPA: efflux RND transporter periplasmic adaptor subunit [Thermoanaerobaculia bacterium]|nr:efflux RND transporter periplasmic adaptor subunit [Thermoanaerobaculia bacterium]
MRRPRARALLCLLTWVVAARCSEKPDAAAAEPPQLEVRATVAPAQTATAVSSIDGRIATLLVAEGAPVQAGATVATLTNAAIDRDIAYAKAQVAVAEQRLRDARRPIAQTLILGDSGARERASAEILKNAEAKRDRYRDLFATHDISKQELEDAESAYAAALRDWLVERERASQKVIQTDTSILQLELERAKAELAFASERRSLLVVKAPIAGVVTRVAARIGDSIFPRDPIVEIANTSKVEVRGLIAPELTRYVRVGMPVEARIFTVPPRRFTVPIKNVLPGNGGATLVVEVPNPDGVLQEGQTAVVTVK